MNFHIPDGREDVFLGNRMYIVETRRHYTNYFKNIPNFKEYRMRLVTANDPQDIFDTLNEVEQEMMANSEIISLSNERNTHK